MDEDNSQALVRHALREQEELSLDWFNKLQRLKAGLEHRYKKSFVYPSQVRSGLKTWFEEVWDIERSNNRKLCFYNKVKETFGTELYLTLDLGYWESKRIAQFRTSSHRYNIETGRYGEKRNDTIHRVCNTCSHNDAVSLLAKLPFFDPIIEDEFHVLLTCPLYEKIRAKLSSTIKAVLQEDPKQIFQTATYIRDISRYLKKAHKIRFPDKCKKNKSTQTKDIFVE